MSTPEVSSPDDESDTTVVVVTGAGSGIGAASARAFGRLGRTVVCVDVDHPALAATAKRIADDGGHAVPIEADVSDDDACRRAITEAASYGRLHALINIAGIMPPNDSVQQLEPAGWDRTMAVNVRSVYSMSRHAIPFLRGRGGVIVNTASVHAYATMPNTAAYAASKGAILALTRQMALDLTPLGIRVVAIAPGSVDTPMSRRAVAAAGAASLEDLGFSTDPRAVGRIGSASEIAAVITWLTSFDAAFVNGCCLPVDGALLARLV